MTTTALSSDVGGAAKGGRRGLGEFRNTKIYWLFLVPGALLLVLLYLVPVGQVLWISVTEPKFGLDNYVQMVENPAVQRVVWATIRICVTTTAITVVLGYAVAYVLVHVGEHTRRLLMLAVLVPFWLSLLARAFAWVTLLRGNGVVNTALMNWGIIGQPLELMRNEFGVMVGMIHYMLPYAILPLLANLDGIDRRLISAARGLGASPTVAFLKIFLPLSVPGIAGAATLVFVFSLGFYVTPAILGGGKTLMLAEMIKVNILDTVRWALAATLASSLLIVILLTLGIMTRMVGAKRLFGTP